MRRLLLSLADRWNRWLGDSDLERGLRAHLNDQGYMGGSAKVTGLRLVAIQRPGWLQVFIFSAIASKASNPSSPTVQLFGIVRQDERHRHLQVETFTDAPQRNRRFEEWSKDLVQLRRPLL